MANGSGREIVRPSVLDRLLGENTGSRSGLRESLGLRELKASVARDLEWLLNTRMWLPQDEEVLSNLPEAQTSVLTYGIPDLSTYSWTSNQDCRKIATLIEKAIRTFEPRMLPQSVRCEILATDPGSEYNLRLHIEGTLYVEPISEHVAFDSGADVDGGSFRVESFE